jgi:hypothetical protein
MCSLAVHPKAITDQNPDPALNQGLEHRLVPAHEPTIVLTMTHNYGNMPYRYQVVSSM